MLRECNMYGHIFLEIVPASIRFNRRSQKPVKDSLRDCAVA